MTSAKNLLMLINDILNFSKIEASKLEFEKIHFNLRNTMDEMVRLIAPSAHKKSLNSFAWWILKFPLCFPRATPEDCVRF